MKIVPKASILFAAATLAAGLTAGTSQAAPATPARSTCQTLYGTEPVNPGVPGSPLEHFVFSVCGKGLHGVFACRSDEQVGAAGNILYCKRDHHHYG